MAINIMSAGAVDREFVLYRGASQSSSRLSLGAPRVSPHLCRSSPRAAPDAPEVAQGLPKPTQRLRVPPELSGADPGRVKCSQVRCLRTKTSRLEHSHRSRGFRRSHGNGGKKCGSEPQSTRAGGQDDGSYTNSLKLKVLLFARCFPPDGAQPWIPPDTPEMARW